MLEHLKRNPTLNYLVDVLPSDILISVLRSYPKNLSADFLVTIVTMWILSSSAEECFLDYDASLDTLGKDNLIYRLQEGLTYVFDFLNTKHISPNSIVTVLEPIVKYYQNSFPSKFRVLYLKFAMMTTGELSAGMVQNVEGFTRKILNPIFEKYLEPYQSNYGGNGENEQSDLEQQSTVIELFSHYFLRPEDSTYLEDNADRFVPNILAQLKNFGDNFDSIIRGIAYMMYLRLEKINNAIIRQENTGLFKESITAVGKSFEALMIGLDESGKTLLLEKVKDPNSSRVAVTIPTIGFNSETIHFENAPINLVSLSKVFNSSILI